VNVHDHPIVEQLLRDAAPRAAAPLPARERRVELAVGALLLAAVAGGIPLPAGVATGGAWAPTLPMLTGSGLVGSKLSIRVTNIGIGTMRVDDVYIDPYRRG
jgi:hypothetical protein